VPIRNVPAGTHTWPTPAASVRDWPALDPGSDERTRAVVAPGVVGGDEAIAAVDGDPAGADGEVVVPPAQPATTIARSEAARRAVGRGPDRCTA
jgi:hypothetical protein